MTAMTALAAVPAATVFPFPAAAANTADRRAWDAALAKFRAVDDAYNEAIERRSAAEDAADLDCPREPIWFEGKYRLSAGSKREAVVRDLRHVCAGEAGYAGWLVCSSKPDIKYISEPEFDSIRAEAERLADDFMAYLERVREADLRHNIHELDKKIDGMGEGWQEARNALLAIPAPDVPALLVKMEMAFDSGVYTHEASSLADAHRLLGEGRA